MKTSAAGCAPWSDAPYDLVRRLATEQPGRMALCAGGLRWTRAELAGAVESVAALLRERGVRPGDTVAVQMRRSAEEVVSLLAVLHCGAAPAMFEPTRAESQGVRRALSALSPRLVLADDDVTLPSPPRPGTGELSAPMPAHALAYVVHTSGSTGRPKAVMVPRGALANRLAWGQRTYPLGAEDVVLHWSAPVFDFTFWEVLAPLCFGAVLAVAPDDATAEPELLARVIRQEAVTCLHFVPSLLREFLPCADDGCLRNLRYVFCGGEPLSADMARALREATDARVFNQYGPAETCIDCTAWELTGASGPSGVPIGRPIDGASVHVLNERGREVPAGVPGMLYVGGAGLAWGYRGAGAGTAEAFVPDPFASQPGARLYRTGDRVIVRDGGVLEYVGRLDRQVKVRGVRLELDEVEAELLGHSWVRHAAVVAVHRPEGGIQLVAHVVLEGKDREDRIATAPAVLRRHLAGELVPAAIPERFVFHDELPRLPSGKLDRQGLLFKSTDGASVDARAGRVVPDGDTPRTRTESRVAELWSELLAAERIGRDDDFFDLGGHSLLALRMLARLPALFRVQVPLRVLFESSTVATFAAALDERRAAPAAERSAGA